VSFAFTNSEKTFNFLAHLTFRPSCFKNENTHCQRTSFILKGNKFNNKKTPKIIINTVLPLPSSGSHPELTQTHPEPSRSTRTPPGVDPETTRIPPGADPEATRSAPVADILSPPGTHPELSTRSSPGADTEFNRSPPGAP
jgi:hypothetical protein